MALPDRLSSIGGIPVVWIPAPPSNYDGPASRAASVNLVIIHDIEGSAQSAIDTLSNPARGGSVHFIADPNNGRYVQMVGLNSVAWGCGNWAQNQRAVQCELPGYAGQPYAPEVAQYAAIWAGEMARLLGVPVRRLTLADLDADPNAAGICGHEDIPDPDNPALGGGKDHHGDPGPTFPWQQVLSAAAAGGLPAPGLFPTGFRIAPRFADAFTSSGGVAVNGYPVSREYATPDGLIVQYYERARLEYHDPAGGGPLAGLITRGRVGAELVYFAGLAAKHPAAFVQEG